MIDNVTGEYVLDEPGLFWWRDDPVEVGHYASEKSIAGHIKIKKNGEIHLELDGVLPHDDHLLARIGRNVSDEEPRVIQGITKYNSKRVLIADATRNGTYFRSHSISYERYIGTICLIGDADFPSNTDLPKFSKIVIDLSGLENWLIHGTLNIKATARTFRLRINETQPTTYQTPFGRLSFEKRTRTTGLDGMHHYEVGVREYVVLTISRTPSFTVEEVRTEFSALQDLLTLLSGSNFQLDWPEVTLTRRKRTFTLIFRRIGGGTQAPSLTDLPLKFPHLAGRFGEIYSSWREKREKFGPGFFYYLSTQRDVKLYVETIFANLVQGLEAFHRSKFVETPVVPGLHNKIQRILGDIQLDKDRKWLADKLQHASEPNLAERLRTLFASLPVAIDKNKLGEFATVCAKLRNDLAHFGGSKARAESATFLRDTSLKNEGVKYLYHMLILKEIGVSDEGIKCWTKGVEGMTYRFYLEKLGFLGGKGKHGEPIDG
ncbi:HEPN domain-containing protein [Ralstonia solanacearum]|uniref:ApeA N-terminal domain 1-containing protein n=1 Tax=Ralstonia solanacearum TaxID=305 RepID=UPI0018D0BE3E|nr:HEPN domain-containing protein [Ralstonia solanacearum]